TRYFWLGPGIVELERANQRSAAHCTRQLGEYHMMRSEYDGGSYATCSDIRHLGLQQAFELEQVFRAEAQSKFATGAVHVAVHDQRRTQKRQREGNGPRLVGGDIRQLSAGEFQTVREFLFHRAVQRHLEGLSRAGLGRQCVQAEEMRLAV